MQHRPWNSARNLSRGLAAPEQFLAASGFDRAPWAAVAFGAGIAAWFALPSSGYWLALLGLCCAISAAVAAATSELGRYPYLRLAGTVLPLIVAAGCGSIWARSAIVGAEPIDGPHVGILTGRVLSLESQPAEARSRIVLAIRWPGVEKPLQVRLNLPDSAGPLDPKVRPGAMIRLRARIMPPAPPMLPGAYDFARAAWFQGLSATGTALSSPEVTGGSTGETWLSAAQRGLSAHIHSSLSQGEAGIAAALATGDMGGIDEADTDAMRDSGLAHLLSVSGLHVSAVVAVAYVLAIRLLALWPWLALRARLPLVAAASGALAGIAYTLLTGAQVPTVRSCFGALLVLAALALGREALSLRMLAVAAFLVLVLWPESVIGPSFQMSFAAVLAIVALSGAGPIRRFVAPREEGVVARGLRHLAMILLTGFVIEIVLLPIGLYHFHRGGLYGAFANVVAIPLTTFVIMPAVLGALVLDVADLGAPAWWIAGKTIAALLAIAHGVAAQPGSVTLMPGMGGWPLVLFLAGGLWLALWCGRVRWWGLVPALAGTVMIATLRPADILVSGDGHHVGLLGADGADIFLLRQSRSGFARDNLTEIAGMRGEPKPIETWPGARCNVDACIVTLQRDDRTWRVLLTRSRYAAAERALAAVCERVDIVISDQWLPRSCHPHWLKADRRLLERTGGLAIDLSGPSLVTVAQREGHHGWWRGASGKRQGSALAGARETAPTRTGTEPRTPNTKTESE